MAFHYDAEDEAFAQGHTEHALNKRVQWVKDLRAALLPFVEGRATEGDRQHAEKVLAGTKEWL
jgi:hypothetical protein